MAAKKKNRILLFVSTISLLTALISITVPEFSSQGIQILIDILPLENTTYYVMLSPLLNTDNCAGKQ